MAAVSGTFVGIQTDDSGNSTNVTQVGMFSLTGLGVGGGPLPGGPRPEHPIAPGGGPSHPIAPGGQPPTIWPSPGRPEHPIYLPPGIWPNPPEGQAPIPEHPIVIPPPAGVSGPNLEVKVLWTPMNGWQVVLVPTGPHPTPSS
jgi:hypothetical protein